MALCVVKEDGGSITAWAVVLSRVIALNRHSLHTYSRGLVGRLGGICIGMAGAREGLRLSDSFGCPLLALVSIQKWATKKVTKPQAF
jgi:hypothetical protein